MTISGYYVQNFSLSLTAYTMTRVNLPQARTEQPSATPVSTPPPVADTVEISPEAAAASVDVNPWQPPATETAVPDAPSEQAPVADEEPFSQPPSRAERRADALLNALDADKDGSITKEEFTDGALALLRRAGHRHHHRHVRGDREERHDNHEGRGSSRLERRLERVFDRVDANQDGNVDKDELTTALAQVRRGHHHREMTPEAGPSSPASTAPEAVGSQPSPSTSEAVGTVPAPVTDDVPWSRPPAPVSMDEVPWSGPRAPEGQVPAASHDSQSFLSVSVTRVTYVAIAVRQYAAVGDLR